MTEIDAIQAVTREQVGKFPKLGPRWKWALAMTILIILSGAALAMVACLIYLAFTDPWRVLFGLVLPVLVSGVAIGGLIWAGSVLDESKEGE